MDFSFVLRGFILGFAIAAPVGPIGLLCIQRTLNQGHWMGLASGLGAATADAFYGAVAAFGLTLVSTFLIEQQFWLALAGGLFLCYLGVRTLLTAPAAHAAQSETASVGALGVGASGLGRAYASTFLLTITNPLTILSFVAIFAGAGLATTGGDTAAAAWIVGGVFLGSAAWWLLLSGGVALLRAHISANVLLWVNRAAGAILVLFGVAALSRALLA
jgi:threonine/homoserine/homoserine lactone efflux protein